MRPLVVGREAELAVLSRALEAASDGPRVLAITGEAGIGKTTVWEAGVDFARERGLTVLICRPVAAEVKLSYQGLEDLLADLPDEAFHGLPGPQRDALDTALLRGRDAGQRLDPRAVAAGMRTVLTNVASSGPMVLAIDDLQWLDEPTRRAVDSAVRRCSGPVTTLIARRVEQEAEPVALPRPRPPAPREVIGLGALSLGSLHHVIKQQIGRSLPRRQLVEITDLSGGNPFFALELARASDSGDGAVPTTSNPRADRWPLHTTATGPAQKLPVTVRPVLYDRIEVLSPGARLMLLLASALASPRLDHLAEAFRRVEVPAGADGAAGADGDLDRALGEAENAGVVAPVGGEVRFTHPLLARAVYSEAHPSDRRAAHRTLSQVVDTVEEQARHLALAAVAPDAATIEALDRAAAQARARGAPSSAAELLELALAAGGDVPARRVQTAWDHYHANDPSSARAQLEVSVRQLSSGVQRAEALELLASIRFELDGDPAARGLLEQALEEAGSDAHLRRSVAMELAFVCFHSGDPAMGLAYVEQTRGADDAGAVAESLAATAIIRYLLGLVVEEEELSRCLALEDPARRSPTKAWPTLLVGFIRGLKQQHAKALEAFAAVRRRCLEQGTESELWLVLVQAVRPACAIGDLTTARRYVDELTEQAEVTEADQSWAVARMVQAELLAWTGRTEAAKAAADEALRSNSGGVWKTFTLFAVAAAGMADLQEGDHAAAAARLAPAAQALWAVGVRELVSAAMGPDTVEALIGSGRPEEAEPLIEWLEQSGQQRDGHWARAVGARCRALLLAARGDVDGADEAFRRALEAHDASPELRYDRARTLLVVGQHRRRRKQRRAAREALTEAVGLFEEVGAVGWADLTRAELRRLGLYPAVGPGEGLTATERHVAELAASGLTNREVAATLYVSPKTVEAHLGRVYRKLGIRSRAELGQAGAQGRFGGDEGAEAAAEA